MALLLTLAAIFVLILFSAFFSGSETALTAASRARIHQLEAEGHGRARLVSLLITHKERLIGAILLGNNSVNILASALATGALISVFGEAGIIYATVGMTLLVFIFAEVLPKTYAIRHADRTALAVAPTLRLLVALLSPLADAVQYLVAGLLRLVGGSPDPRGAFTVSDEIRAVIDMHAREGSMRKHYRDMLRSVLDLSEVEVGEIMVHRKSMATIEASLPAGQIVAQVLDSPFTRIPLWRDDPDNIVGVLHAKNLFKTIQGQTDGAAEVAIADVASEPWFVPDTTTLADQLAEFRRRREHFALVVDEYGALMGLVTLEDILEEIVGEIVDEHDRPTRGVQLQPDGSYLVDGAVTIRDLNRAFDWRLPDDEASTVAGLVIHEAKRIPEMSERFRLHGFDIEIIGRKGNQITALRLQASPTAPEPE